jgi:hypothetical protein
MTKEKLCECEKNNSLHWYGNYWFSFGNTDIPFFYEKPESFISIKEQPFVESKEGEIT